MTEPLEDLSPMPFGVHKGKPMQDVPASYLHWWWEEDGCWKLHDPVSKYIQKNKCALMSETLDLIWT